MIFYSKKIIFVETRYETHDQKLLAIIINFQQWRYYLKENKYAITMINNHNNFRYFMITTSLNRWQTRWTLLLIEYNFEIKYKIDKFNLVNVSFKRSNYENEKFNNELYFSILQNKLRNITIANIKRINAIIQNRAQIIFDDKLIDQDFLTLNVAITQKLQRSKTIDICDQKNIYEKSFSNKILIKI